MESKLQLKQRAAVAGTDLNPQNNGAFSKKAAHPSEGPPTGRKEGKSADDVATLPCVKRGQMSGRLGAKRREGMRVEGGGRFLFERPVAPEPRLERHLRRGALPFWKRGRRVYSLVPKKSELNVHRQPRVGNQISWQSKEGETEIRKWMYGGCNQGPETERLGHSQHHLPCVRPRCVQGMLGRKQ